MCKLFMFLHLILISRNSYFTIKAWYILLNCILHLFNWVSHISCLLILAACKATLNEVQQDPESNNIQPGQQLKCLIPYDVLHDVGVVKLSLGDV